MSAKDLKVNQDVFFQKKNGYGKSVEELLYM